MKATPHTERPAAVLCGDLNMLRCFEGLDIQTWVVASEPHEVTLKSRYCRNKALIAVPSDAPSAISDLEALGRGFREKPVLFYGTDAMLLLISRARERLSRHFKFRMPDAELVEKLVDKRRFAELAELYALPVPETVSSHEVDSARELEERIRLPCVFKPSVHIGWFKARASHELSPHKALSAETSEELQKTYEELRIHCDSFVVQHYVPGGEENIYSYHAYLNRGSVPLGQFVGKKLRTYPKARGVSTYLELVKEPELIALGRELCERLGLSGPVKLDFKRHATTGRFYLLEINPRFTLWNYLGAVSGVNLPGLAYADLTGGYCETPVDYRTSVRWLSFGNDLRAFLRDYRHDGTLGTLGWLRSYRGQKVYDIFSWRDPVPFLAHAVKFSKAFSRRVFRTTAGTVP